MAKLINLPSEVLREICLAVLLIYPSESPHDDLLSSQASDTDILEEQNRIDLIYKYSNSKLLKNSFISNISMLHNCRGNSMDSIYETISLDRCERKNLVALSLACKRLHEVAEPLIWTMVEMDQESKGSVGDLVRILHTVMKRPELAGHVKALAFRHFYLSDGFPPPFTAIEEREMSRVLKWDSTQQVATLFDALPNLRALKLSVEYEPEYFGVFQPSMLYPSGYPLGLQNLTELAFHWEDPDGDGFDAPTLLPLFQLPNLKTLYLGHPLAAASDGGHTFPDLTRYHHTSSITSLIIDFGNVEVAAINAYLKLPKALDNFEYSYGGGSHRCSNAEIGEYFHALLPQKSSLKTLKIRGCRDMQSEEGEGAADPAILRAFRQLKEFVCPVRLLLFRDGGGLNYTLEEALPPTAEKVTLLAYDDWSFDKLHDEIKNFFSFGKRRFPLLGTMRVECWLKPSDYKLHMQRGETKEDAMSVIRSRIESLRIRGKDKGVKLDFEIDTLSKSEIFPTE